MRECLLPATTATELTYTTVHEQFSVGQKVIGFWFLGAIVPLVFKTNNNRGGIQDVILTLGDPKHEYIPYEDFGVDQDECLKILTFNIQHYYQCYLPNTINKNGKLGTPYTMNKCRMCNVSLVDCKGDVVQAMTGRKYRVNRFIRRTHKTLQNENADPKGLKIPKGCREVCK